MDLIYFHVYIGVIFTNQDQYAIIAHFYFFFDKLIYSNSDC